MTFPDIKVHFTAYKQMARGNILSSLSMDGLGKVMKSKVKSVLRERRGFWARFGRQHDCDTVGRQLTHSRVA
jgi:hypothetical protein